METSLALTALEAMAPADELRRFFSNKEAVSQERSIEGAVKSMAWREWTWPSMVQWGIKMSPGRSKGSSGSKFCGSLRVGMPAVGMPADRHIKIISSLILL